MRCLSSLVLIGVFKNSAAETLQVRLSDAQYLSTKLNNELPQVKLEGIKAIVSQQISQDLIGGRSQESEAPDDYYTSPYYGPYEFPDLSTICLLTTSRFLGNDLLVAPDPMVLMDGNPLEVMAVYYNLTSDAMIDFADTCHSMNGSFAAMNITYDDSCEDIDVLNFPMCMGYGCSGEDLEMFAKYLEESISAESATDDCPVELTTFTDASAIDISPAISAACSDNMEAMMFESYIYDSFYGTIIDDDGNVVANSTAIDNFTQECEGPSGDGRVVTGSLTISSTDSNCEMVEFSNAPVCVPTSCSDEEAQQYIEWTYQYIWIEGEACQNALVAIGERSTETDETEKSTKTSKSPKSPKTTSVPHTRSPKTTKSPSLSKSVKSDMPVISTESKSPKSVKSDMPVVSTESKSPKSVKSDMPVISTETKSPKSVKSDMPVISTETKSPKSVKSDMPVISTESKSPKSVKSDMPVITTESKAPKSPKTTKAPSMYSSKTPTEALYSSHGDPTDPPVEITAASKSTKTTKIPSESKSPKQSAPPASRSPKASKSPKQSSSPVPTSMPQTRSPKNTKSPKQSASPKQSKGPKSPKSNEVSSEMQSFNVVHLGAAESSAANTSYVLSFAIGTILFIVLL
ncbi:hypothetical protein CTEN210_05725 [Chaetoceros tenuissimus]|uniref:Uncharacterized protein n=1 Tax=Chaetoceros tenuissimus TaxID=426638 RepID=A0AAD3H456_9STRA|nr:hypothetical protein CTEN210_05725 [Chaetoceros tenuissimus]